MSVCKLLERAASLERALALAVLMAHPVNGRCTETSRVAVTRRVSSSHACVLPPASGSIRRLCDDPRLEDLECLHRHTSGGGKG